MRKRRLYPLLLAFGVLAVGLVLLFKPSREPSYGGKTLSEWLDTYAATQRVSVPQATEAAIALRQIGTNGFPYLLKLMEYDTPAWKKKLYRSVNRFSTRLNPAWQLTDNQRKGRAEVALATMIDLGPPAQAAIPELIRLLNDSDRMPGAINAGKVLQSFARAGVPALAGALANRDKALRVFVCFQLAMLGENARPALPSLMTLLHDPDPAVRDSARKTIRMIDPQALNTLARKDG